jgi:hypothetical protein
VAFLLGQDVPLNTLDSILEALDLMGIFNVEVLQMVLRWGPKQVQKMAEPFSPELRSSVKTALSIQCGQFNEILKRGCRRQEEEQVPDRHLSIGMIHQDGATCLLI